MNITHVTATNLKQNTSAILNSVFYKNTPIIIEKHGKPIAKIIPFVEPSVKKLNTKEKLNKYFGSMPNIEPAKPNRFFRRKNLNLS